MDDWPWRPLMMAMYRCSCSRSDGHSSDKVSLLSVITDHAGAIARGRWREPGSMWPIAAVCSARICGT